MDVGWPAHGGRHHSLGLGPGQDKRESELNGKHACVPCSLFLAMNVM